MTARQWDLDESFKPVYIALVAAVIASMGSWFAIQLFVGSTLGVFYLWILVAFFVIGAILWPVIRRQDRRLTSTHKGYNQQPVERPFFWFGSANYNRYRIDKGVMQGMRVGFDAHAEKLDRIEREQRDEVCEVCGDDVHNFPDIGESFYVVEDRKVYRVFGIPIREKVLGWETYCSEHKPKNFT